LALVLGVRDQRSWEHGRPFARRRPLAAWQTGTPANGVLQRGVVRGRRSDGSSNTEYAGRDVPVQRWRRDPVRPPELVQWTARGGRRVRLWLEGLDESGRGQSAGVLR